MKEPKKNEPLVLTGNAYVHGALESDFPSQRCPRQVRPGTFRIHSHLDEDGRKKRARGNCSGGYSGVIRASLFDGKAWRKFMLARESEVEQRSFSQFSHRADTARIVLRILGRLKGKTCIYRDGAYAVDHTVPVADKPQTAQPPKTEEPKAAPPAAATTSTPIQATPAAPLVIKPVVQATLFGDELPSSKSKPKKACKPRRISRRPRRKKVNKLQGELF
ncbi:MAG: hypothetical protein K2X27_16675 [Candidatus Obscuribacterales bacterium]|nr:hypothetical protein [Candidatus Obscuribacterales bacterium]